MYQSMIKGSSAHALTHRLLQSFYSITSGEKEMYEKFAQSTEISTVVGMHLSKEHLEEAKKYHLNVVIAGHIASDNLVMNLLLDEAMDGDVEVIEVGGFRRVAR